MERSSTCKLCFLTLQNQARTPLQLDPGPVKHCSTRSRPNRKRARARARARKSVKDPRRTHLCTGLLEAAPRCEEGRREPARSSRGAGFPTVNVPAYGGLDSGTALGPSLARSLDSGYRPGPLPSWVAVFRGITRAPAWGSRLRRATRPRRTLWSRSCPFKMYLRLRAGKPVPTRSLPRFLPTRARRVRRRTPPRAVSAACCRC